MDIAAIQRVLDSLVADNLEEVQTFIALDRTPSKLRTKRINDPDLVVAMVGFLRGLVSEPELHRTFKDIVYGGIISLTLRTPSIAETAKGFSRTVLFLDTNFLLNLFGFDREEENRAAEELVRLIKEESAFSLRVFDFTVTETIQLLNTFEREHSKYLPHFRINTLYSRILSKGWRATDVRELIVNIEKRLYSMGIALQPTGIELQSFNPSKPEARSAIIQYKPNQPINGQNHDLASIEQVVSLRARVARRVEDARYFFLTADMKLVQYDIIERGHDSDGSVAEAISARALATILWLKKPTLQAEMPLELIVAMHSNEMFIEPAIWDAFFSSVRSVRKESAMDDRSIAVLLYDQQVQDDLRGMRPEEAPQIDARWIKERADRARQKADVETERRISERIEEVESVFGDRERHLATAQEARIAGFQESAAEREEAQRRNLLDALAKAKAHVEARARLWATILHCSLGITILLTLWLASRYGLWCVLLEMKCVKQGMHLLREVVALLPTVALLGYGKISLNERVQNAIFNRVFQRMLGASQITVIETALRR